MPGTRVFRAGTGLDTQISLFRWDIQRKLGESGLRRNPVLSLDYLSLKHCVNNNNNNKVDDAVNECGPGLRFWD